MKILLRYGFCHTIVLDIDKGSKFFGVCHEAIDLLQINCHILSSANHNPMVLERINRYLVKGLKIMCNKRDSVRVAMEAILLLLFRGGTDKTNYYLFLVSRNFMPQPDLWSCCCLQKLFFGMSSRASKNNPQNRRRQRAAPKCQKFNKTSPPILPLPRNDSPCIYSCVADWGMQSHRGNTSPCNCIT